MTKELLWLMMVLLVLWHLVKLLRTNPRDYRLGLL
jgi:hypothetical protein